MIEARAGWGSALLAMWPEDSAPMHLEAAQEHLIAPGIEPRGIVFFSKHHDDKTNHDSSTCALFHGLQGTGSASSFNNPGQTLPSGNEEAELSGGSGAVPQIPPLNRIKISASPQGHSAVVTGTPCSPFWKQRGNLMGGLAWQPRSHHCSGPEGKTADW